MVIEQNVHSFGAWDSDNKQLLGMISIRDMLEIIVFLAQTLKEALQKEIPISAQAESSEQLNGSGITEKQFLQVYFEKYLLIN